MDILRRYITHIFAVLFILSALFGIYNYKKLVELRKNPQQIAQEETKELVRLVGKLIVLPSDETPTVATVNKPDALKDQAFFANAKEGYKVLIFTVAGKAILYDPVSNKIVEVAPINIGASQKAAASAKR